MFNRKRGKTSLFLSPDQIFVFPFQDQRGMFIAQYSSESAATYAKKKLLHNLDCEV